MSRKRKLKEHPASVFREGANVTFMDLALETRTQIYGYILENDGPIAVQMTSFGFGNGRGYDVAPKGHKRSSYSRRERAPPSRVAVMFISRQVYEEACGVFYGENHFQFTTTLALDKFLQHLDIKRVKQLRHLEIMNRGYNPTAFARALPMLQKAECLRTLRFHHVVFCQERSGRKGHDVEKFASLCGALAEHLHQSHEARNVTADVLDIVQIVPGKMCWSCYEDNMRDGVRQVARDASINAKVRSCIADKLGITETEDTRHYAIQTRRILDRLRKRT